MIENAYTVTLLPQDQGKHFVHRTDCQVLPEHIDLVELGSFDQCTEAIPKARELFSPVNGCALCCPDCHEM